MNFKITSPASGTAESGISNAEKSICSAKNDISGVKTGQDDAQDMLDTSWMTTKIHVNILDDHMSKDGTARWTAMRMKSKEAEGN